MLNITKWNLALWVALAFTAAGIAQQADTRPNPPNSGANAPLLNYKLVNWPQEAKSAAGFDAGPWNFIQVSSLAVHPNGNILVLHRGAHPVIEFDQAGKYIRSWGDGLFSFGKVAAIPAKDRGKPDGTAGPAGAGYSAVYGPAGCDSCGAHTIRTDPNGNLWIVDAPGHVIYKTDGQGKILMQLGTKGVSGLGPRNFNLPTDIAFAANGDIYVSDGYANARIVKFTKDGKYLLQFGKRGTGPGEFGLPHNVQVDAKGRVYVSDRENQRVEVFDGKGEFLSQWAGTGGYSTIHITKDQKIWTGAVLRELDGTVIGRLSGAGGHGGMAVTDSGDVYIGQLSGRVDKYVKQ
jgi:DNA-binding beta-propeller fold protein YncE